MQVRHPVRDMPFRRRHEGLTAFQNIIFKTLLKAAFACLSALFLAIASGSNAAGLLFLLALSTIHAALQLKIIPWQPVLPVNPANKNCLINSLDEEDCWNLYRFKKTDLHDLMQQMQVPNMFTCDNGIVCPGEHAVLVVLFRLHNPTQLYEMQNRFGREYSQLSRIFNTALDWIYDNHREKVVNNIEWYSDRFDLYNHAIKRKIATSPVNPVPGTVPEELFDLFGFLDGHGQEISRVLEAGNLQNAMWNGYLHGHYIQWQGASFPDGMLVIDGPFPG